jgi:hypothetical protein
MVSDIVCVCVCVCAVLHLTGRQCLIYVSVRLDKIWESREKFTEIWP